MCDLPALEPLGIRPGRHFWALVQHCETAGKDATKELVTYTKMQSHTEIIELAAISCGIGRVPIGSNGRWGIIDRSNYLMRPTFIDENEN